MKTMFVSGLMLALLAGSAVAQSAPPVPGAPAAPVAGATAPQPPAAPPMGDSGARMPPPPPGPEGRRPPPPPSRAAHFRLERGDAALDVKCADDEPMRACADIALQLLDKLQTLPKP